MLSIKHIPNLFMLTNLYPVGGGCMIDKRLFQAEKGSEEISNEGHFWRDMFLHSLDKLTPKQKERGEEQYEPLPFSR